MDLPASAVTLFDELRASAATPAVVDWLWRTTRDGSDFDCVQINPFRVASEVGVARRDATRTFLFATRLGITDLTWDIHCPSCSAVPEYHRHLMDLPRRAHCALCGYGWDLSIEDQLEASFTLNPNVRPIDLSQFTEQKWPAHRERMFRRFERSGRLPLFGLSLPPHSTAERTVTLAAGDYAYQLPGDMGGVCSLVVEGPETTEEQLMKLEVSADGMLDVRSVRLRPGPVRLVVKNGSSRTDWGMHARVRAEPKDWVSAAYLTSLQDFRDLFTGEFLAPDRTFAIRNTTLLFSDITGSTEMYERLGDARAFALVHQHFELMTEVIRRHDGGIVKTIGDAVMATFPVNADAVKAALEIQEGFARVAEPLRQISVKIGLHRGPTIAVTSNRLLDYFGRTVNIAARVQGSSESGEVLVSEAVLADGTVRDLLRARHIEPLPRRVSMKGIEGSVEVFSLKGQARTD